MPSPAELRAAWEGVSLDWLAHELDRACQGRPITGPHDALWRAREAYRREEAARREGRPAPGWVGAAKVKRMTPVRELPAGEPYEAKLAEARRQAAAMADPHHGAVDRRTGEQD